MIKEGKPRCYRNWSTPGVELCSLCRHDSDCLDATDSYRLTWMISVPKCFSEFGSIFNCPICKHNHLCRRKSKRPKCFGEHAHEWCSCSWDGLCERYHIYASIKNIPAIPPACLGYLGELISRNDCCASCEHRIPCQQISQLRKEDENPSCLGQVPRTRCKCWTCRQKEQCDALIQFGHHEECFGNASPCSGDYECYGCDEEGCCGRNPSISWWWMNQS